MARLISSGVGETMNALAQWGQQQRANKALNLRAAQTQLQELARLGIRDDRTDRALSTIMGGGNTLGMLLSRPRGVPGLVSSLDQTDSAGQRREFTVDPTAQKVLDEKLKREKGLMLHEAIRGERKNISEVKDALSGLTTRPDDLSPEAEMDRQLKADLEKEKGMAEFRLGSHLEGLKADKFWSEDKKKSIAAGKTVDAITQAKGGPGEFVARPREQIEKLTEKIETEKNKFFEAEDKRLAESIKTGGPLSGTETQMRAKTRRDFKILFDQALSIDDKRKVYDDYADTMRNIDNAFRRKSYYPRFEQQFSSLFGKKRGVPVRKGGGGGVYSSGFAFYNPKTKSMSYVDEYGGKNRADALAKLKKDPKYADIADQLTVDHIIGKNKLGAKGRRNYNESLVMAHAKTMRKQTQMKEFKQMKLNKTLSGLGSGSGLGFNDTALNNALDAKGLGIKNKSVIYKTLRDDSAAAEVFRSITPEQKAMTLRFLDSLGSSKKIASAMSSISRDPSRGMQVVAEAMGKGGSKPRTTVRNIAGPGSQGNKVRTNTNINKLIR